MKKSILSIALFAAGALTAIAQPAPKILVVDMAKLLDSHYETETQNAKLRADEQKAREEIDKMNQEGNALVEQYKAAVEKAQNPALSSDAKSKAEAEAKAKLEEIQKKQGQVQNFQGQTQRSFQQRIKSFRDLMLEEIGKTATEIAKKKGATMLLDKSGPSLIGINGIVYFDPSYDITEEVMKEINKNRPAGSVAVPAPAAPAAKVEATKPADAAAKPAASEEKPLFVMPK